MNSQYPNIRAANDQRQFRRTVEAEIERLIALLDLVAGDPDLEDNGDDEPWIGSVARAGRGGIQHDLELDMSDDEPSLGWTLSGYMGPTFDPDREQDPAEMGEPEEGQ